MPVPSDDPDDVPLDMSGEARSVRGTSVSSNRFGRFRSSGPDARSTETREDFHLEKEDDLPEDDWQEDSLEKEFEEYQQWRNSRWKKRRDDDDDDEDRSNVGPPPSFDGTGLFEDYEIKARLWLATTKTRAAARGPQLLRALSNEPFNDFKHLIKDKVWMADKCNGEKLLDQMGSAEC